MVQTKWERRAREHFPKVGTLLRARLKEGVHVFGTDLAEFPKTTLIPYGGIVMVTKVTDYKTWAMKETENEMCGMSHGEQGSSYTYQVVWGDGVWERVSLTLMNWKHLFEVAANPMK